jgi:hypothetical protein
LQPAVVQRGVPTQFLEEKQKVYEQEKRRIAALAEKKLETLSGSRSERDAPPSKADSYNRDRDGGRDSGRVHERDEVKRHSDRDSHRDSGRASGSRGVSNTPAWMVAEMEASKSGGANAPRSRGDHKDDRVESRKDDDSDRQRRPDSGGGGRISNSETEGKDRGVRDSRRRDDRRERSRERDSRRDSGRRDRSRDRDRDRRSRSGSRNRGRKDRDGDERSSRRDDGHARRSRRSRSPIISSSSSGGSLSPASR